VVFNQSTLKLVLKNTHSLSSIKFFDTLSPSVKIIMSRQVSTTMEITGVHNEFEKIDGVALESEWVLIDV